jgi:hypothetical protein
MERRAEHQVAWWHGLIPEADLSLISHALVAHRLALFGIDPDAAPLLERRQRGF